jgi:ubiquinol-cytochrome c reductase cytochrome c subunit
VIRHSAWALICAMAVVLAFAALGTSAAAQESAAKAAALPAGNVENGKRIFKAYGCYQCHGYSAQGGAGARLAPSPITLPAFTKYIRSPRGQMPAYTTKVVSDTELADIYAFIHSLPKPPDAKSIPMLNN